MRLCSVNSSVITCGISLINTLDNTTIRIVVQKAMAIGGQLLNQSDCSFTCSYIGILHFNTTNRAEDPQSVELGLISPNDSPEDKTKL